MLAALALLMIGYSVFASLQISVTHFSPDNYRDHRMSRMMGIVLLAALSGLQLGHFTWLQYDWPTVGNPAYQALLFAVAPSFYLFSTPLLKARALSPHRAALHALPILAAPFLPVDFTRPAAFLVGAAYLLVLGADIYSLRSERDEYRRELVLLGAAFVIAILVTVLALGWPQLPERMFFELYSISIGMALLLITITLARAPQLSVEVSELAQKAYSRSTLGQIDVDETLTRLDALMREQELYRNADLDLKSLADRVDLPGHQLSELINSRLGKGVSRYIRDYRVADAQRLLLEKPSMSVLAISLEVGFSSQSSFYTAFREQLGMTPGKYREIHTQK